LSVGKNKKLFLEVLKKSKCINRIPLRSTRGWLNRTFSTPLFLTRCLQ
jgi:hypothetical protein